MTCTLEQHFEKSIFSPPLTCEVEDLRPLLADVDTDVRPSYSQVGTTLVKHEGLDLTQKHKENKIQKHRGVRVSRTEE